MRFIQTVVNTPLGDTSRESNNRLTSVLATIGIIVAGIILVVLFREPINAFGVDLMIRYGQEWADVILFLLTAVSCTPLVLPVWGYAILGVALGYHVVRLAVVMAFGSALGSLVTFGVGRYFSERPWVKRRFPGIHRHRWTHGKSKKFVAWILFIGASSPIPCDVLSVACGVKRFPPVLFLITIVAGRFVRYLSLGYGYEYFSKYL